MTETVALISGKGGSGKTALALTLGYLAASAGVKTLLVDADLGTHGMTYFFVDRLLGKPRQLSLTGSLGPGEVALSVSEELDFVPSVASVKLRVAKEFALNPPVDLGPRIQQIGKDYEFVLVDCQAGITPATRMALIASSVALVVTEADPISIWAVNDLVDEFREDLPDRVLGVVNKALKEEQQYFEALVDISQVVRYVGQLPYDLSVRRAYFRREPPVSLSQPSPFVLSLAGKMRSISPTLGSLTEWQAHHRLGELAKQEVELRRNMARRYSLGRATFRLMLATLPAAAMVSAATVAISFAVGRSGELALEWLLFVLFALMLGVFAILAAVLVSRTSRGPFESDVAREAESRLAEIRVAYESILKELEAGQEQGMPDASR